MHSSSASAPASSFVPSAPSSSSVPSAPSSGKGMRKNARGARKDVAWEYGDDLGDRKVKCKFCSLVFTSGAYRFKHHLARTSNNVLPCSMVPEDVKVKILNVLAHNELSSKKKKRHVFD